LLKLNRATSGGIDVEEVYFLGAKDMQNHHGGMILLDGHIYCGHGHNLGLPLCIDMLSGKDDWRPGRGPGDGSAAISYADGRLYFRYQNGVMALIEATPKEYMLKGSFKIPSGSGPSWPHPAIAHGHLYLRDQDTLFCYDIRKKSAEDTAKKEKE
jgi:outer membrane protein assembly factor BamB